jgi:hypothetical protein
LCFYVVGNNFVQTRPAFRKIVAATHQFGWYNPRRRQRRNEQPLHIHLIYLDKHNSDLGESTLTAPPTAGVFVWILGVPDGI